MSARARDRPEYRVPRIPLLSFGLDLLLGRARSFAGDSRTVLRANAHPRVVEGVDRIPAAGAFILVMNHFSRRGLRPYHCAMIVTDAVAARRSGQPDLRWAFTSEYRGRRLGPVPIPLTLIRWLFRRVALVYGFVIVPRRQELVVGRAAALRRFVRLVHQGSPVGLTPEGAAADATGPLVEPPEGSGLFLALLGRGGVLLLPVGVFEQGQTLVVRFGAPFVLVTDERATKAEQDRSARTCVMTAIASLLPHEYRGKYGRTVEPPSG
jgi:hypothetical protein